MKCDELKDKWFNAYPEIMGIEGTEPAKCYGKADVDAAIAELKAENRKLKRALWLARAERAKEMCKRLLIQGFDPKWEEVERKCRAKAEDITR